MNDLCDPTILPSDFFPGIIVAGDVFQPLFLVGSVHSIFNTEDMSEENQQDAIYFHERAFYTYVAGKQTSQSMELLKFVINKLCAYREYLALHSTELAAILRGLNAKTAEYIKKYNDWAECEAIIGDLHILNLTGRLN